MSHLFISYARADGKDFARQLKGDLEAAGHETWIDMRMGPGALFDAEIEIAIEKC